MSMSLSAHKQHQLERQRREDEERRNRERDRLKWQATRHAIALWNMALAAGWRTIFWPSVGSALRVGCHWLHIVCPACRQMGEVDLRTLDYHPDASIAAVVRKLSCQRCCPNPPFAVPLGVTRRSWYGGDGWQLGPRMRAYYYSRRPSPFSPAPVLPPPPEPEPPEDIGWGPRMVAFGKAHGGA
jgi:hypothetical protein